MLIGAGNLANALAPALRSAGYKIEMIAARELAASQKRAAAMAKKLGAKVVRLEDVAPGSVITWICHTDDALNATARRLARKPGWKGKIVLHSSGALTSDVLAPLQRAGAHVASLHPMMTFVPGTKPDLSKVPFAVEGDAPAVTAAKRIVHKLGAEVLPSRRRAKCSITRWDRFPRPWWWLR